VKAVSREGEVVQGKSREAGHFGATGWVITNGGLGCGLFRNRIANLKNKSGGG